MSAAAASRSHAAIRAPRATISSAAFAITQPRHAHRAAGVRAAADGGDVGVAGEEPHLRELDAEPLDDELREAGLVALAGRQRADHDVDAAARAAR